MELAETRTIVLTDLVLDLDDLRNLVKLVKELSEWQGPDDWTTSIRSTAPSGAKFETSDTAILNSGGRIEDVGVYSFALLTRKTQGFIGEISVNLTEGDASKSNQFTVSGTDSNWVAGCVRRLDEFFAHLEQQRRLTRFQRRAIVFGVTVALLALAGAVASLGFRYGQHTESLDPVVPGGKPSTYKTVSPLPATGFTLLTIVLVSSSWPLGIAVRDWVEDLWPLIEFRIGRHHVSVDERRRASVGVILTLVLVPLLVSVAAGLFLLLFT